MWRISQQAGISTVVQEAGLPPHNCLEFTVNKKPVRFTDHFGHDIQHLQATVPVIYATNKPELAIMDKGPLKNWLEVYIWLFGLLCGVLGLKRFNQIRVSDL